MDHIFRLVSPDKTAEVFGVKLVGVNQTNLMKLLVSIAVIIALILLFGIVRFIISTLTHRREHLRSRFWALQISRLVAVVLGIIAFASIWFDDPVRLTTAAGLVTAGLAFALQKVITAIAGYFVILRGKNFTIGDRITMGGVRGDVIALGLIQTKIMEMGQPPSVQNADPAMWVRSRQYTGRIVTVSNARIFDEPIYNYTMDFPYIWDEMIIPIPYSGDYRTAEKIALETALRHTLDEGRLNEEALDELQRRYFVRASEVKPFVYLRLTDNWIELSLRFVCESFKVRELKDRMSRDILAAFEQAEIKIASTTQEIVGLPELRIADSREKSRSESEPAFHGEHSSGR